MDICACSRVAIAASALMLGAVLPASAQPPRPIGNPTPADLERGATVFAESCARCHGLDGSGGAGPRLTRPKLSRAANEAAIIEIVRDGVPGGAMPAIWILPEADVVDENRARAIRALSPGSIEQPSMIGRDFRPWLIREAA